MMMVASFQIDQCLVFYEQAFFFLKREPPFRASVTFIANSIKENWKGVENSREPDPITGPSWVSGNNGSPVVANDKIIIALLIFNFYVIIF